MLHCCLLLALLATVAMAVTSANVMMCIPVMVASAAVIDASTEQQQYSMPAQVFIRTKAKSRTTVADVNLVSNQFAAHVGTGWL